MCGRKTKMREMTRKTREGEGRMPFTILKIEEGAASTIPMPLVL
jgi:hypothetical protein